MIQPDRDSPKGNEFVDLFAKGFVIMNTEIPPNNYKKCTKKNWDKSKNGSDIFETDKGNTNVERNNSSILNFDYDSNSI